MWSSPGAHSWTLAFLVYINDLHQVSEYFMPILFADDTNLFATGYNLNDIVFEINKEIASIYAWVKANKLSLNIDKPHFMLFTPKCVPRHIKGDSSLNSLMALK